MQYLCNKRRCRFRYMTHYHCILLICHRYPLLTKKLAQLMLCLPSFCVYEFILINAALTFIIYYCNWTSMQWNISLNFGKYEERMAILGFGEGIEIRQSNTVTGEKRENGEVSEVGIFSSKQISSISVTFILPRGILKCLEVFFIDTIQGLVLLVQCWKEAKHTANTSTKCSTSQQRIICPKCHQC